MRRLFAIAQDLTGNLPPLPDVFPDQLAPVVRVADGERQLEMMRWGMPGPPKYGGAPVTNIRNTSSPHWRAWLGPDHRCLVPANSFCEYADTKGGQYRNALLSTDLLSLLRQWWSLGRQQGVSRHPHPNRRVRSEARRPSG